MHDICVRNIRHHGRCPAWGERQLITGATTLVHAAPTLATDESLSNLEEHGWESAVDEDTNWPTKSDTAWRFLRHRRLGSPVSRGLHLSRIQRRTR